MQTSKYTIGRFRVIILYKIDMPTNSYIKLFLIKTFKEKTTFITKNLWFYDKYIRYFCSNYIHDIRTHLTKVSKYCP